MEWQLRFARDGHSIAAGNAKSARLATPRALPEWYLNRPPEVWGARFYYVAYKALQSCRPPDGAIPWTAVMAYAGSKGLAPDLADALWTVISCMDLAERAWRLEEAKQEAGGGN